MEPPAKRMKYDAGFKLKVVAVAKESNNCVAARPFGIDENLVRDWKKKEDALLKMQKKKCAARFGVCHWPALETYIEEWVRENRQVGISVSRHNIRSEALKWAKKESRSVPEF